MLHLWLFSQKHHPHTYYADALSCLLNAGAPACVTPHPKPTVEPDTTTHPVPTAPLWPPCPRYQQTSNQHKGERSTKGHSGGPVTSTTATALQCPTPWINPQAALAPEPFPQRLKPTGRKSPGPEAESASPRRQDPPVLPGVCVTHTPRGPGGSSPQQQ